GRTAVTNPATCVLIESKRFPLVWNELHAKLPTWRRLLPETRDPRDASWKRATDQWVLKTALCNTGDTVSIRRHLTDGHWRRVCRDEIFTVWAPPLGPWSPWVKPVLFASLPETVEMPLAAGAVPVDISWAAAAGAGAQRSALLLDLPGDHAVRIAVALAQAG